MKIHSVIKMLFVCSFILSLCACTTKAKLSIDLSGRWLFKIDSMNQGLKEKWFQDNFSETINLPGSMAENGKGNDVTVNTHWTGNMWNDSLWYKDPKMKKYRQKGNVKVPFWLTPVKEYKGSAWYQKTVTIPDSWSNKNINLHLERVHWESTVWVDDKEIGMQNSLGTAHNYSLDDVLTVGDHTITIRIDNSIKDINVGLDAHSISDNTQSNWNGIVGNILLNASPKAYLKTIKITSEIANKRITVHAIIDNQSNKDLEGNLTLQAKKLHGNGSDVASKNEKRHLHPAEKRIDNGHSQQRQDLPTIKRFVGAVFCYIIVL